MRNLVIIFLLGISIGLLIGLRQQHKQKDYMIKMLLAQPKVEQINLPKIEELK